MGARADERQRRDDITITGNDMFDRAHGVRSGRGTAADPYVISGWQVHHITIADTSKAVRIVDNRIDGTLTLNWIGRNVLVRGNDISDLRVNENVERTGAPTSGVIEHNRFGFVGQLRHFDGMFMHNTVGSSPGGSSIFGPFSGGVRAVNFDGFNGAHFAHNTIYGYVEARLHGHHHSSSYGDRSHMHTAPKAHPGHGDHIDHTTRFHEVVIEHNTIHSGGPYGLLYVDTNHRGNDRRATSETNPKLELPHVHHTRVHILGNVLIGSGITVDIFNAQDERHERYARGLMHIEGNDIRLEQPDYAFSYIAGIQVWQARNVALRILDNVIAGPAEDTSLMGRLEGGADGLVLDTLDRARVTIAGLRVSDVDTGVRATQMSERVRWSIIRMRARNVSRAVAYDESVANEPQRR